MFQFPSLPLRALCIQARVPPHYRVVGFPIRRSRGQRLVSTSPGLIAAAHVLRRLLAPRHPPCALSSLTKMQELPCACPRRLPVTHLIQLSKSSDIVL